MRAQTLIFLLVFATLVNSETCVYQNNNDSEIDPQNPSIWKCDESSLTPSATTAVVIQSENLILRNLNGNLTCLSLSLQGSVSLVAKSNASIYSVDFIQTSQLSSVDFQLGANIQSNRIENSGNFTLSSLNDLKIVNISSKGSLSLVCIGNFVIPKGTLISSRGKFFIFLNSGSLTLNGEIFNSAYLSVIPLNGLSQGTIDGSGKLNLLAGTFYEVYIEGFEVIHLVDVFINSSQIAGDFIRFRNVTTKNSIMNVDQVWFMDTVVLHPNNYINGLANFSSATNGKVRVSGYQYFSYFSGDHFEFVFSNTSKFNPKTSLYCVECTFSRVANEEGKVYFFGAYFAFSGKTIFRGEFTLTASVESIFETIQIDLGAILTVEGLWEIIGTVSGRGKIISPSGSLSPSSGSVWRIDHVTIKHLLIRFTSMNDYTKPSFLTVFNDYIVAIGTVTVVPFSSQDYLTIKKSINLLSTRSVEVANPSSSRVETGFCINATVTVTNNKIVMVYSSLIGTPVRVDEESTTMSIDVDVRKNECFKLTGFQLNYLGGTIFVPSTNGTVTILSPRERCKNGALSVRSVGHLRGYPNNTINGPTWVSPYHWPPDVANTEPKVSFRAFKESVDGEEYTGIYWNPFEMNQLVICKHAPVNVTVSVTHRAGLSESFMIPVPAGRFNLSDSLRVCDSVQFVLRLNYFIDGMPSSTHWTSEIQTVAHYPIAMSAHPNVTAGGTIWSPSVLFNFTNVPDWCLRCPSLRSDKGVVISIPGSNHWREEFWNLDSIEFDLGDANPEEFLVIPICRSFNQVVFNGTDFLVKAPPRPKNVVHFDWNVAIIVAVGLGIVFVVFIIHTIVKSVQSWRVWNLTGKYGFVELP